MDFLMVLMLKITFSIYHTFGVTALRGEYAINVYTGVEGKKKLFN